MKKIVVYGIVFLSIATVIISNLGSFLVNGATAMHGEKADNGIFDKFNTDAKEIEDEIREAERQRLEEFGGSTADQIADTLLKLENGEISLRQIFSDTFIAGDSLMNGLEIYGILNTDKLATQVSASLSHLEGSISAIVSANPENIILHYGINMISAQQSQLDNFIENYSELIIEIKDSLPDARIIISGLFPVDTTVETREQFKKVADYNKALSDMCKTLEIEFLDSTKAFEGNEDYYAYDGIHVSSGFYSKVWLPYIIENKGIIG